MKIIKANISLGNEGEIDADAVQGVYVGYYYAYRDQTSITRGTFIIEQNTIVPSEYKDRIVNSNVMKSMYYKGKTLKEFCEAFHYCVNTMKESMNTKGQNVMIKITSHNSTKETNIFGNKKDIAKLITDSLKFCKSNVI